MDRKELISKECPARFGLQGQAFTCIGERCVAFEYTGYEYFWWQHSKPSPNGHNPSGWRGVYQDTNDPMGLYPKGGHVTYEASVIPQPDPNAFWVDNPKQPGFGWWILKNTKREVRCSNYSPDRFMPE